MKQCINKPKVIVDRDPLYRWALKRLSCNKEVNKVHYRKYKVYVFYVRGKSRKRFAELIGFTIDRKMQRLLKATQKNKISTLLQILI